MATTTANYAMRKAAPADLVDVAADIAAAFDTIDGELGGPGLWRPSDSGLVAWTSPPEYNNNTSVLTMVTNLFYVYALRIARKQTVTGLAFKLSGTAPTGSSVTHSQAKLYDAAGTQLAATTDSSTGGGTFGTSTSDISKAAFSSTCTPSPGLVYVLLWIVSTQANKPTFTGQTVTLSNLAVNDPVGLSGSVVRRGGSFSTGSGSAAPNSLTVSSGVVTIAGNTGTSLPQQPWLALY
jgi:hypothetical protein